MVLLSDLKFGVTGVREYVVGGVTWTLVVQGKVGIALNEEWANKWRRGGAKVFHGGRADCVKNRVCAAEIPRKGEERIAGWSFLF